MSLRDRLTSPGPKRILALDGGGIRGALAAGYLQHIEGLLRKRMNRPGLVLADYFDLIGGTSTGAIIAGGLAIGMTAEEVTRAYLSLGRAAFRKVLLPFKARFDGEAVRKQLESIFGDRTLGDASLRTGLCVVAKRADTGSVWPLINHPDGAYYPQNAPMPLRDVIRASTAAPTYFVPETLDVGGELGAFVDGGVSMANNPALQLFLVATLKGFPFHWPTGENRLLIVSIGTGYWKYQRKIEKIEDGSLLQWAAEVPTMLMDDANWQNQLLLQYLSRSPTAYRIDGEVGELQGDVLGGIPQLSYLRYNAALESGALVSMGLPELAAEAEDLREMSDADNVEKLLEIGRAAARQQVFDAHFPAAFNLP